MLHQTHHVPVIVIGAGIAGLWVYHRLRRNGVPAVLLESNAIGSGQTIASQGIIHGGTKYALKGELTESAKQIATMTSRWKSCLEGTGELDLSRVRQNAHTHYLWLKGRFSGAVKSFVSTKMLSSDSKVLSASDYPEALKHIPSKGSVCALDEIVLDVPSLLFELANPYQDRILQSSHDAVYQFDGSGLHSITLKSGEKTCELKAQHYIFAAGTHNAQLINKLDNAPLMQERPLHMVWVRFLKHHSKGLSISAHLVPHGTNPEFTITSHQGAMGELVWYLGGEIAESGVKLSETAQIARAKARLSTYFPTLELEEAEWGTHRIVRAENENQGRRPELPFCKRIKNCWLTWPTKLTFAPLLSDMLVNGLDLKEERLPSSELLWEKAPYAKPIWDTKEIV